MKQEQKPVYMIWRLGTETALLEIIPKRITEKSIILHPSPDDSGVGEVKVLWGSASFVPKVLTRSLYRFFDDFDAARKEIQGELSALEYKHSNLSRSYGILKEELGLLTKEGQS